jgi:hypothetical protein
LALLPWVKMTFIHPPTVPFLYLSALLENRISTLTHHLLKENLVGKNGTETENQGIISKAAPRPPQALIFALMFPFCQQKNLSP